jgi:hypothetical protein
MALLMLQRHRDWKARSATTDRQAAADLEFERAAALRDKARQLEQLELQMR